MLNFQIFKLFFLLLKRLLIPLILFSLLRLVFLLCNLDSFQGLTLGETLLIFIGGIRFDISSILIFNSPIILLHILPFRFRDNRTYQRVVKVLFVVINSIILIPNLVDAAIFHLTMKRLTMDVFGIYAMGDANQLMFIPQYVKEYWYLLIVLVASILLMIKLYNALTEKSKNTNTINANKYYIIHTSIAIIVAGISIVGIRGGLQYRPLSMINAGIYADAPFMPLVLNSTFTIIKTINKEALKEQNYFDEKKLDKVFTPFKTFSNDSVFKKKNVVILIMESFSKEYIGALNKRLLTSPDYRSYTPFLDSLIEVSYVFTNAFANGHKSIDALPAIIAGIPSLMDDPFITSNYSSNKYNSIATILKKEGYSSSFYHGGINGTMGFDAFIKVAGFDLYYGKNEYNNDSDFDGNWGIYDEPYFQYFAKQIDKTRQPFFNVIFSLSSHHPYKVPEKYNGKFTKGTLEIHESIGYADFALRQFFESARKMKWFDNTLFVLTADHASISHLPYYKNKVGMYAIPILFFCNGDKKLKGIDTTVIQQTDIVPSILSYLNYQGNEVCFGENVFNKNITHFNVNYINGFYQLIIKNHALLFDGKKSISLYDLKKDSLLTKNIISETPAITNELEVLLKAIIQQYNHALITNHLVKI